MKVKSPINVDLSDGTKIGVINNAPGNILTKTANGEIAFRTPLEIASDIGAVTESANNTFTGTNTFTGVLRNSSLSAGFVMASGDGTFVSVDTPYKEREPIMVNPPENGQYYLVMPSPITLDVENYVLRGTGNVTFEKSSTGESFSTISEPTAFATNDVLRINVTDMGDYLTLAIPQIGGGYEYEPLMFNPSEDGQYYVTFDSTKTMNLPGTLSRGVGTVTFDRSTDGVNFTVVSDATVFNANDVLRLTVSGIGDYYAFTIPRTA